MAPGIGEHPDDDDHQRRDDGQAQHRVEGAAHDADRARDEADQQHQQGDQDRRGKKDIEGLFAHAISPFLI